MYFNIDEYLRIIQVNDWMSIHAHAIECSAEDHSIGHVIFLECSRCRFQDSLCNILGEKGVSGYLKRVKGMDPKDIERVNCPKCTVPSQGVNCPSVLSHHKESEGIQKTLNESTVPSVLYHHKGVRRSPRKRPRSASPENVPQPMKFLFKIVFVLQSTDLSTLLVVLESFSAVKVFGITPQKALVHSKDADEKLFKVLDTICPESWEDKRRTENVLNWIIKLHAINPSTALSSHRNQGDNVVLIHSVLTVTPVCSSQVRATSVPEVTTQGTQCDAAVGCNLSGRSVLGEKHFLFDDISY